jgi:acetoin utilization deacetylase AcuC-like enzyme
MILYKPGLGFPLREYGISIPAAPDRAGPVLDALRSHPRLGARQTDWLSVPDDTRISREDVLRVNTPRYARQLYDGDVEAAVVAAFELIDPDGRYHRYDPSVATKPLRLLFDRALNMVAGTYQCGTVALDTGFCFHCGGGAHHGHPDFGHGFCILNDSPIAVRRLQAEGRIRSAWIIDIDVHKGDGTAAIFKDDDSVMTMSIHMAHGWPLDIPEFDAEGNRHPSYIPSDLDVPIEEGEESHYLSRLKAALARMETGPVGARPDIAYVLAGADPYEKDELESTQKLKLTLDQMNKRNRMVYEFLSGRGIPQAWLMAGGYGGHAWETYPDILTTVLLEKLMLSPESGGDR